MLIIVMAAVVAPSFSGFFPGLKVQKAGETFMATCVKARTDAVLTLRRHRIMVVSSPADGSETPYYYLAFEADPLREPGSFRKLSGAWGQPEELPTDVALEALEGALDDTTSKEKYFEFKPDGTATEAAVTFAHPKGDRVTVKVAGTTGRVTLEEATEQP